jgi:hypothetical protein
LFDIGLFLDDGHVLDWTKDTFLDKITQFKVGIGNVGIPPNATMTDLNHVVIVGDIMTKTVYSDKVVFTFELASGVVQDGLSEVGLFDATYVDMYVIATHPKISKVVGYTLQYEVVVYFGTVY